MRTILWRRLDREGHESSRLRQSRGTWYLDGTAVFTHEHQACRLDYVVVCDSGWRTLSARVTGWLGAEPIARSIAVDSQGQWWLDTALVPAVAGCVDVDLNFSPATNLLPIRRLDLAVGQQAEVRAAWLRFPAFTLEPLVQSYRRTGERTYRYESGVGNFVADLEVDDDGVVVHYPGLCARVS